MIPASSPAFIAELKRRAVVRVAGPDARSFLQGLLTQDVERLAPDAMRYAAMLTPQGRLLFDLFLAADAEDGAVGLDVEAARRDDLIRRLTLYRLRAKVEIAPEAARVFAAWGGRPAGDDWRPDPRLAELGWRALSQGAPVNATEDDYDAWRLSLGVPDPIVDCAPDSGYPIEFDLDLLNAIDFHKGCFVGQETTSRMKRRGQIKTRTLPIDFDGPAPAPGSEILAGALRAGEVLSGRDGRALALVRLDRIEGAELTVDDRPVRVAWPTWWPVDVD